MALAAQDLERFVGQWVVVQSPVGSLEGQLVEVTATAFQLHPVLAMVRGAAYIDEYSVVGDLQQVLAVRGCSRAVAEEAVKEMQEAIAKMKTEAAAAGPQKPVAGWGNPL